MNWKVGDWVIYDMEIKQVTRIEDNGIMEVTCGIITTSGRLANGLRPLTIRNKRIGEGMQSYYKALNSIDGHSGFNYPEINRYFCKLALEAIDGDDEAATQAYSKARDFLERARNYEPIIDGVRLFRRAA